MTPDELIYEQITEANLSHVWAQARPLFVRALATSNGELTSEDIRRGVLSKDVQLFVAHDKTEVHAVMATEFVPYPRFTALRVIALAGRSRHVLDKCVKEFWSKVTDWAKAQGVEKVEASCHPGMARLLHRYGFYTKYHLVVLDLE